MAIDFKSLTEGEKWEWHAEVYAFRRLRLGVPYETRTSPCDPDGVWWDDTRVYLATERLKAKQR